jgi:hypothetical protein
VGPFFNIVYWFLGAAFLLIAAIVAGLAFLGIFLGTSGLPTNPFGQPHRDSVLIATIVALATFAVTFVGLCWLSLALIGG